ncbi:SET domain-containing protein [Cavenderia fasciculata]|uniref:Protein-lysine N-methyltransferase SMYD4 n=1 Tax=Cavenderia fasciculata TaxID=261658 RepID=F4PQI6_CACFS|nr:SET domain-containing protein [Cavenderia fasciculata]EGG22649.1 SET domain-containing protein [Cavenderia fasciculata]|eukprot:XP_004360500.1 SET domain-containing protein [Cavenderia fasciculata]
MNYKKSTLSILKVKMTKPTSTPISKRKSNHQGNTHVAHHHQLHLYNSAQSASASASPTTQQQEEVGQEQHDQQQQQQQQQEEEEEQEEIISSMKFQKDDEESSLLSKLSIVDDKVNKDDTEKEKEESTTSPTTSTTPPSPSLFASISTSPPTTTTSATTPITTTTTTTTIGNTKKTTTTSSSTKSKSSSRSSSTSSTIADKYHQIMLNQLGLAMGNGAQHAHMGTITNANMLVNPATMQPPPTSSIGQSCKYGELKHRSLLTQALSRTLPPIAITGKGQNIALAARMRYDTMQINEKIDIILGFWNLVSELKRYTINTFVNSTTQSILDSKYTNKSGKEKDVNGKDNKEVNGSGGGGGGLINNKTAEEKEQLLLDDFYSDFPSSKKPHKKQKTEKKDMAEDEEEAEERAKLDALLPKEQTSKAYKNKGNELFQKKQYYDALLLYGEALRLYNSEPTKDPQILISIHSNRCLCLVHLEKFEEGAMEATRGLECNPEQLAHKLLYRRGICNFSLRRYNMAKKDFQDAHKLVSKIKMDGSDLQSIESYLEKIGKIKGAGISDSSNDSNGNDNGKDQESIDNQKISIVDSRVSFRYASESLGRIAEATDDIKANTILIKENAYVTCLDRASYSSHCHNCFKETLSPIFCKKCNHSQYCSEKCLNQDFIKYHEMECSIGFLLLCSSEGLLTIRLLAQKAKEKKKNKDKQQQQESNNNNNNTNNNDNNSNTTNQSQSSQTTSEQQYIPKVDSTITSNASNNNNNTSTHIGGNRDYVINSGTTLPLYFEEVDPNPEAIIGDLKLYHPNYDLIYSFDPHYKQHSHERLVALIIEAFLIQRFLVQRGHELGIPKEDATILTIVRHLCQLSSYIYSIPVFITQDDDQERCHHGNIQRFIPIKIAYAIFPVSSLLNHSCDNNTILQYNGSSITIKSLKNISKNDEITGCYGPHAFHLELRERLECLKEEYFFICRCHACNAKIGPNLLRCPTQSLESGGEQCKGTLLERVDTNSLGQEEDDSYPEGASYDDYNGRKFVCSICSLELGKMDCFMLTSQSVMSGAIFSNATKLLIDTEHHQPPREVEEMLFKCLEIRKQIYHVKSRKIGEVYDALSRYYIAKDKYKEAVTYAERAINNIFLRLGHSHSTELAREWAKLANIYINAGEPAKAIKAINTSESLLVKWKTEPSDDEILAQLHNHKKVLDASKLIPGTNKVEINLTQLWCSPDFDSDQFFHRMILYHKDKNNFENKL